MLEAARLCQLQGQVESARRLFQQSHQLLTDSPTCANNPQIQEQVKEQLLVLCANSYDQGWVSALTCPLLLTVIGLNCGISPPWPWLNHRMLPPWPWLNYGMLPPWPCMGKAGLNRKIWSSLRQILLVYIYNLHAAHIYDLHSYNLPRHVCYLHLSVCLWYWLIS